MKKFVVSIVAIVIGFLWLAILWGVAIEPRFILDEVHETVEIPSLPLQWAGQEVAVIGDFQIGMWLANKGMVEKAIKNIKERQPAAVLVVGDFLYSPTDEEKQEAEQEVKAQEYSSQVQEQIAEVKSLLHPLVTSDIPVYAVLGNHDYAQGQESVLTLDRVADQLANSLEEVGIEVLRNEVVAMKIPSVNQRGPAATEAGAEGRLYIGGVGPTYPDRADVDKVLSKIPKNAPRLIMMHNPHAFSRFPAGTAPLAVAGHFHGGQVRIPGLPNWSWMSLVWDKSIYADGWGHGFGADKNRIYVNRGLGFSRYPVRINCPPEVTYFELQPAS